MAGSFSNPRLAALPCERMRGVSFAENFISGTTLLENFGTDTGTGNSFDHGLTSDGNGYVDFDIQSQPGGFSATVRFSAAATSTGILIGNANLIAGIAIDGFCIWVDGLGVRANHSDGVGIPTRCEVDISYADRETHTATYVVDMDGGKHRLFVDALAVDEHDTSISTEIGTTGSIVASGDGTNNFIGSVYRPRIFDAILSETEHDLYHADNVTDWFSAPMAAYRCDSILNDTDGNKVWNRTVDEYHLDKADRVTTSKFPTFDTDKYFFDLVDDYIGNVPTLPTAFTITAATSTPQEPYPIIQQDNDTSFIDLLSNEGDFWGYLHSLVIHGAVLTAMQLYHDEYQHMYWLARGRAAGYYARLIAEGTCKLAMFLDSDYDNFIDYSRLFNVGTGYGVTKNGSAGCTFPNANSQILVEHDSSLNLSDGGTIAIYGDFDIVSATCLLLDKNTSYAVVVDLDEVRFYTAQFPVITAATYKHIAITFRQGFKARLYIDGVYHGESDIDTNVVNNTDNLVIGNLSAGGFPSLHNIKQVLVADTPATEEEIRALFESAQVIGATSMEVGNRTVNRQTFTAVPVAVDFEPAGNFQLIDVALEFNIAPTTSENLLIQTTTDEGDTIVEHSEDLSLLGTARPVPFRFDKRFKSGRNIKIDYANTDARTIVVLTTYQIDQSVV